GNQQSLPVLVDGVNKDDGHPGVNYSRVWSSLLFCLLQTPISTLFPQVDAVRVYVNSSSENLQYPVLFVVRQQKGVLSWQVPLIFRGLYQRTYNYQEVSRTLCPSEPTPEAGLSDQVIFVDVASMAPFDIAYELLVTRLNNFQLETNKAFNFTASPSQPQYFLYKFPQDVDSVIIKVISDAVYPCSVVSVQDIVCPVYDLDHNVEFNGVYQSMTKQAAITVQKKDFPGEQFFVVFVIKPEDYACGGSVPSSIHDLSRKDRRIVSKKYKIYFWNIITIAVFYALPVIQLVITYQTVVNVTGNQDICYYNFLCAHPLGVLSAFNNILSNVGHMLLGFLFLLIVLRRDILHRRAMEMKDVYTLDYGIPKHFGLFYAMGIALMMEGVLSACYHVCPNYSNFQFDTSFMYMIAGLCMLKLYQTRHPDINASAYSAYASFAVVICLAVLGVVFGKNDMWFWVIFSVIHVVASLALSTQIYYMGRFKIDLGIFRRAAMVLYTDCIQQCSRPMYMDRMVLLIVGNLVNWSFAIFGLVYRPRDFASYILGIFICNLLLYLAFYIIMKLRSSEKLLPIPLFCIVATAVMWAAALYFFFQNLSSWEETPAESREKNRPCILLGFFDDHDVWHFLSAAALFFSFLVSPASSLPHSAIQHHPLFLLVLPCLHQGEAAPGSHKSALAPLLCSLPPPLW
uniref:SID1 transmembrane family member 1 n=1 Tax=Apteryx owenii TaxID=8824 RepID=A0A8B9QL10_APTOW